MQGKVLLVGRRSREPRLGGNLLVNCENSCELAWFKYAGRRHHWMHVVHTFPSCRNAAFGRRIRQISIALTNMNLPLEIVDQTPVYVIAQGPSYSSLEPGNIDFVLSLVDHRSCLSISSHLLEIRCWNSLTALTSLSSPKAISLDNSWSPFAPFTAGALLSWSRAACPRILWPGARIAERTWHTSTAALFAVRQDMKPRLLRMILANPALTFANLTQRFRGWFHQSASDLSSGLLSCGLAETHRLNRLNELSSVFSSASWENGSFLSSRLLLSCGASIGFSLLLMAAPCWSGSATGNDCSARLNLNFRRCLGLNLPKGASWWSNSWRWNSATLFSWTPTEGSHEHSGGRRR